MALKIAIHAVFFLVEKKIFLYTGQFVILNQVKIGFKFLKIRRPKTPKKCT